MDNKSHRGRKSLVIGGSRGIGSFVSKVISLFGAEVTISYLACEQDALEVRDDINKNTIESMAQIVKFDVLKDNYDDVFKSSYDDLYYFATPKIFDNYSNSFSNEIYKNFRNFYANCFEDIALKFIKSGGKKIYYPSSVAVLNKVRGMEEYTKAKKDGEYVCEELKKRLPVKILVDRIDRVNTSQTLSIMPIGSLEPYEVAISIAKKME